METLFRHIDRFVKLQEEERELLSSSLKVMEVKKKTCLLKEGQVCRTNYFIAKGCMRMYYVNDKGVEQIVQFGIDNWWLTDLVSYSSQAPSQFYIRSVEPCSLILWERQQEEQLLEKVPALERYFRLVYQRSAAAAQQRSRYFSDFTGEERYHHFQRSFPEFVQRIPQYMLASFLGFTPEFMSKIRATKR